MSFLERKHIQYALIFLFLIPAFFLVLGVVQKSHIAIRRGGVAGIVYMMFLGGGQYFLRYTIFFTNFSFLVTFNIISFLTKSHVAVCLPLGLKIFEKKSCVVSG